MCKITRQAGPDRPRQDILGWAEQKSRQLFSISLRAVAVVFVAVGTYVLLNLVMRVFDVLDKLLEHIGRCLP